MKVCIAKVQKQIGQIDELVGCYVLKDGDETLGYFVPGTEFLFEDYRGKEIKITIEETERQMPLEFNTFSMKKVK